MCLSVWNPNFIFSLIRKVSGAGVIDSQPVRSEDIFQIDKRDFLTTEAWAYLPSCSGLGRMLQFWQAPVLLVMGMVPQDPACCFHQLLYHGVWIPAADSLLSQAQTGRMLKFSELEQLSLQVYCLTWSRFCVLPVFSLSECDWISHWWVLSCWD